MFIDLLRRVKGNINKKYLQKLVAKSMIMKMIGFSAVLAVVPVDAKMPEASSGWVSEVKIDTSKSIPAVLPEKQFSIKVEPQPVRQVAVRQRSVITRERTYTVTVSRDPGLAKKRALVQAAAARFNIPWQVLEAVWQVESGKSWDTGRCSYAGACGPMQFIPSTFRAYAVDGDGDGVMRITDAHDAVYSAARYLAANGANRGQVYNALYRYNHSSSYVYKVLQVARSIGYVG